MPRSRERSLIAAQPEPASEQALARESWPPHEAGVSGSGETHLHRDAASPGRNVCACEHIEPSPVVVVRRDMQTRGAVLYRTAPHPHVEDERPSTEPLDHLACQRRLVSFASDPLGEVEEPVVHVASVHSAATVIGAVRSPMFRWDLPPAQPSFGTSSGIRTRFFGRRYIDDAGGHVPSCCRSR
jgi:hypothetical protein